MTVILQMAKQPDLCCFQHNAVFHSKEQYEEHLAQCEAMCSKPNVKENGQMCGHSFRKTVTLIVHNWVDHNVALCSTCDEGFSGPNRLHELEVHVHTSEQVHDRKLNV